MKLKITLLALIIGSTLTTYAQFKFGPVIDLSYAAYSTKGDSVTLKGGLGPAFGITIDKYISYWLSLRGTALYAFKTLNTTRVLDGEKDKMNGQFFDLCVAGRFSDFDNDSKILPYGLAGLGAAFTIVSKRQENHMVGTTYNSTLPYFTVGAGIGIKMGFFSEIDLSVNYNRYLAPVFTIPIDDKAARLNQFSLRFTGLF